MMKLALDKLILSSTCCPLRVRLVSSMRSLNMYITESFTSFCLRIVTFYSLMKTRPGITSDSFVMVSSSAMRKLLSTLDMDSLLW